MPLTDVVVRNAKPSEKAQRLFDGGGLYLEISPAGGKWWRLKYRFDGKEKRLSLGVYPDISLKEARDRRDAARKLLADGVDPGANRKIQKAARVQQAANSFEVVAREWYAKHSPGWAASHSSKIIRRLENDVFPWIGSKPISDITAPELLTTVRRVESRGAIDTAHRTLQNCGQIFRYAVATGRTDRDPSGDLRGAVPPARASHYASIVEPDGVGELLRAMEGFRGTLVVMSALKLAPLLFVRPGELRKAEWSEINLDAAEWNIPAERMKARRAHLVPLATQAVKILQELYPLTGHGHHVFPGRDPQKPMSEAAVNAALRRLGYDTKTEITGHGFRAMARTLLHEELEVSRDVIEHQLAHRVPDALGAAYNRTKFIKERRRMMQVWADYLDEIKVGAKVIPIRSA